MRKVLVRKTSVNNDKYQFKAAESAHLLLKISP